MAVMAAAIEMPDSMALMLAMALVVAWHYSEKKKVVVVNDSEEDDGSTDSGCVVANAENNVEVVVYAVVAIALGSHIDLVVVVLSDLLLVVQVVVLVVGIVDYLFEIFVEASSEEECWEADYNY